MSKKRCEIFGQKLLESVLHCFQDAYVSHARGASKDAILIHHDIFAAASDQKKEIIAAHRSAILSAIDAVDAGVPLPEAHAFMRKRLTARLGQMLDEDEES